MFYYVFFFLSEQPVYDLANLLLEIVIECDFGKCENLFGMAFGVKDEGLRGLFFDMVEILAKNLLEHLVVVGISTAITGPVQTLLFGPAAGATFSSETMKSSE